MCPSERLNVLPTDEVLQGDIGQGHLGGHHLIDEPHPVVHQDGHLKEDTRLAEVPQGKTERGIVKGEAQWMTLLGNWSEKRSDRGVRKKKITNGKRRGERKKSPIEAEIFKVRMAEIDERKQETKRREGHTVENGMKGQGVEISAGHVVVRGRKSPTVRTEWRDLNGTNIGQLMSIGKRGGQGHENQRGQGQKRRVGISMADLVKIGTKTQIVNTNEIDQMVKMASLSAIKLIRHPLLYLLKCAAV